MPARARKETGMTEEQLSGAQGAEGAGAAENSVALGPGKDIGVDVSLIHI